MASTTEPAKPVLSEAPPPPPPAARSDCSAADVALRILLFAASVTAVVVMVTSKQTEIAPVPGMTNVFLPIPAKFNHSPAFIYFVAALSVAGLYSIITALASISVLLKPDYSKTFLLFFLIWDVIILGIVASATGAAGGVGYIGLKGNKHVGWTKVCPIYDKFCRHIGGAVAVSLFAAILLVLLTILSACSLSKKIRD